MAWLCDTTTAQQKRIKNKEKILMQLCKSLSDLQVRGAQLVLRGRKPREKQNTPGEINSNKISAGSNPISYKLSG